MPNADRVINFSLGRVGTDDGTDVDTGVLGDQIYGQVSNVSGGQVVYAVNESQAGDAVDRYWNGQFSLADLTFTLLKASERPESLGPGELVLDLYVDWYEDTTVKTQVTRYRGFLMNSGERTLDRTTDSPRNMTFVPYQHIDGGGDNLDSLTQDLAALYADSRAQELSHRPGGTGTVVHVTRTRRTAHTG